MTIATPAVLSADLGKTSSRATITAPDGSEHSAVLAGVAAQGDGGRASAARLVETIGLLPASLLATATACGIGAAGTLTHPAAARHIARAVRAAHGIPVAVTSDVITAHAGAFAGAAGVALIAGTGAVAVGLSMSGELRRADGWGPDIGDLGGGSWIGREGIRAVLGGAQHPDVAALSSRLLLLTGGEEPVRWVARGDNPAGRIASFAPLVIEEAQAGNSRALGIVEEAVRLLGATAAAAVIDAEPVAALGGLTRHPWFAARLHDSLAALGFDITETAGDALAGGRLIAVRTDLPHERHIHRA
jgi:glucosamine kinase